MQYAAHVFLPFRPGRAMSGVAALSNRFHLVARERLHGIIGGVDFGYHLSCLARSPAAALFWSAGTPYTSGRQTCYGESCMYAVRRTADVSWWRNYRRLGGNGGRLTFNRVAELAGEIDALFDDAGITASIVQAVRSRQTLLIEGGGEPFTPSRRAFSAATTPSSPSRSAGP